MSTASLAALIEALEPPCREALEEAAVQCAARGAHEISVEDYVECLLPLSAMQDILAQFACNEATIRNLIARSRPAQTRHSGRPAFSPMLYYWLQEACLVASLDFGRQRIGAGELVLALLKNPLRYGMLPCYREFEKISSETLRRLLEGLHEEAQTRQAAQAHTSSQTGEALAQFCIDFTADAREGRIDPVFARGPEIRLIVDILSRRRKNNPILVGDPGVGKTAVVEGLALRIVQGLVPEALKNVRIVGLDMGRLQAGASVKGEFERRLKAVIDEIKASPIPAILFIDEAHTLVGSGNTPGSGDGANLLKPSLARGELRTIAATTWSEYKKYFEKDAALARRFQPVKLDEPSAEETVAILRGIVPHYEKAHQVYVRDDAVIRTAELSARYISGRHLPDKAIDVLDTACARVRISLGARPAQMERREEELATVRRELEALERDALKGLSAAGNEERHAALRQHCAELQEEISELARRWHKEKDLVNAILACRTAEQPEHPAPDTPLSETEASSSPNADATACASDSTARLNQLLQELHELQGDDPLVFYEVSPALVTSVVAEWTGIPAAKLTGARDASLNRLGETLRRRVRGQDQALSTIEEALQSGHAGLNAPTRPTGIFLLVGPSGVGKTETALAVADALFGGERMMITINMSEFQEKHTISRLIGSPPGYVGYGEGGRLTEAVRRQPYSVVLFDEVEKAHPDVLNLFYQLFDKGQLADGEGRDIDFRNTVIFLTSNLGSEIVLEYCENEQRPSTEMLVQALRPALSRAFRPALLGRMTIVPYLAMNRSILQELAELKLNQVARRVQERHHLPLYWDEEVVASITASCQAVDTGARNIDLCISSHILPRLASALTSSLLEEQPLTALHIALDPKQNTFICTAEAAS